MSTGLLFLWRKALTSKDGPEATTRHILLTLSLHMDQQGNNCFPSIETLVEETGLSRRSVIAHLSNAEQLGWIIKGIKGISGKGWKRNEYRPQIPIKVVQEVHHEESKGGVGDALPKQEGGASGADGGASDDTLVVQEVHTSTSTSTSKSTPLSLSELLLNLIKARRPTFKSPDLTKWEKNIDYMIRLDDRKPEEVEKVIRWCQKDWFWQNNILSTGKLRAQFDQLAMKMEGGENGSDSNRGKLEGFAGKEYKGSDLNKIPWNR